MKSLTWRVGTILVLIAASVFAILPRDTKQRVRDPMTGQVRDTTVRRVPISMGLDLSGGIHLELEVDESRGKVADCRDAIRRAERVVRTRINEFGTTEPVIQVVGDCRLIVEIPGETEPARAKALVQQTAFLEFRITDTRERFRAALPGIDAALRRAGVRATAAQPSNDVAAAVFGPQHTDSVAAQGGPLSSYLSPGPVPGQFFVSAEHVAEVNRLIETPQVKSQLRGLDLRWGSIDSEQGDNADRALYALESRPIITGEQVRQAMAARDPDTNEAEVQFELTKVGGRAFGQATERNVGNYLAILLDGRVQGQPPVIRERIESNGRIQMGNKPLEEANDLALVLRAGALPVPLQVVKEGTIGPSLGNDSTHAGIRASILAVVFVLLVMGTYYGRAGFLAVGALSVYLLLCLGGLAAFGFTLTLPGLAGFALSIVGWHADPRHGC
jgi:protein-export membrane protein SecD